MAAENMCKNSEVETIPDKLSSSVGSPGRRTPLLPYEVLESSSHLPRAQ